jgi:hypothetical protein
MKSDLREVEVGDKIWTIQHGWVQVVNVDTDSYPIETDGSCYTIDGKRWKGDKYPSAFLECPFKEQVIEKDTLVWFRDGTDSFWKVGYYSHFEDGMHQCFIESKKSTETDLTISWNILTTENPLS